MPAAVCPLYFVLEINVNKWVSGFEEDLGLSLEPRLCLLFTPVLPELSTGPASWEELDKYLSLTE